MEAPEQPQQEPTKQIKRNIFSLLKDPIIWMIIGIATLVCILIFLLIMFIWRTLAKNDKTEENTKNAKNIKKKKQKEEPPPSPQQTNTEVKKEEIISTYVSKTPETKIEISETSDDGDGSVKVEEI